MNLIWLILLASWLLSVAVQNRLHSAHRRWGSIRNSAGLSGAETASKILAANQLTGVGIEPVRGRLTDHYDPRHKTVALSESVYQPASVAAMAVAAHETGHALQHEARYPFLVFRTALAPLASTAASYGIPAAIFGAVIGLPVLIDIGILSFVAAFLFQLITLPVEFNASRRAMAELDRLKLLNDEEREGASSMLRAAAMTYVASAAPAALYLIYLIVRVARWVIGKTPPLPPPRLP